MSLIAAVYNTVLSLRKRTWASGMTVRKYEIVKSPADMEDYERITATGGGTTDPADDVTNYVARSYRRTMALSNISSFNSSTAVTTTSLARGSVRIAMPTASVGVRTSVLSVTGKGNIDYLALNKSTGDSMLIEVICDGLTIFSQNPAMNNINAVALVIGGVGPNSDNSHFTSFAVFDSLGVEFKRSLQVYVTPVTSAMPSGAPLAYHLRSLA